MWKRAYLVGIRVARGEARSSPSSDDARAATRRRRCGRRCGSGSTASGCLNGPSSAFDCVMACCDRAEATGNVILAQPSLKGAETMGYHCLIMQSRDGHEHLPFELDDSDLAIQAYCEPHVQGPLLKRPRRRLPRLLRDCLEPWCIGPPTLAAAFRPSLAGHRPLLSSGRPHIVRA